MRKTMGRNGGGAWSVHTEEVLGSKTGKVERGHTQSAKLFQTSFCKQWGAVLGRRVFLNRAATLKGEETR